MRHGFHFGHREERQGHCGGRNMARALARKAMGHGVGRGRSGADPFGDDFAGGPPGGFSGGRRRLFDNMELRLLLLDLIRQEPRHGYDLIRAIESLSGGLYVPSPGMVYPALTLMTEMDQLAEQPSEGTRKRFAITDKGQAWLASRAKERDAALARLKILATKAVLSSEHAPVRRAMENLKAALRIRLEKEGADKETMLDVAALIDEAAAKIERLK